MGFIEEAVRYGYQAEEILKMISSHNPQFKEKVDEAVKYGYTPTSILRDVSKFFQGVRGEKTAKVMGINPKWSRNLAFSEDLDPATVIPEQMQPDDGGRSVRDTLGNVAGAGIGASVGYATGGPVGAVTGATTGSDMYQKLVDKYRRQGRNLSFGDFVKTLASASAKGTATGFSVKFLMDVLQNLTSGKSGEQAQPTSQPPTEEVAEEEVVAPTPQQVGSEDVTEEKEVIVPEGLQAQAIDPMEAKASYDVMTRRGIGGILERVQQDLTPMDALKLTRKMFGNQSIKDIERERKKPFEQVYEEFRQYQPQESKAPVQQQQAESIEEVAEEEPQQNKRKISRQENPKAWSFQELLGEKQQEGKELKGKARPFESSLKSGNLSAATFDKDTGQMRVVFRSREGRKGGDVYEYDNLDLETFNKMTSGSSKPITEGSNKFGVWFNTKNPSIGAAFDKYIKKNKEQFPYKKVEPKGYSIEESKIIEADRAHLASELFEPFAKKRLEGRQRARAQGLKDIVPALKNMDDDFLFDVVDYLENELKGKLKNEPKVQRLAKEFEKEFQR